MKSRKLLLGLAVFFLVGAFAPMKASPNVATEGEEGTETVAPAGWVSIGPNNVSGRVRALIYDRFQEGVMYAGGVGGGLFVSVNGGNNWQEMTMEGEGFDSPVTALAQGDDGSLYVATGEGFYNENTFGKSNVKSGRAGNGVFKVTRGEANAATWTLIEGTQPVKYDMSDAYAFVNDLAFVDGKLYIATKNGGLKVWNGEGAPSSISIDGNSDLNVTDIKVNREGKIAIAYDNGGSHRVALSSNGVDFVVLPFSQQTAEETFVRIELAFAPKNNNMLYALVFYIAPYGDGYNYNNGVFKADINAENAAFGNRMTPNSLYLGSSMSFKLNEAMAIAVNDLEQEYIYVGGSQLFRLFDANGTDVFYAEQLTSSTASLMSGSYVAPGIHTILFDETPSTLADSLNVYVSTDAGVFRFSEDVAQTMGYTWRPINKGLNTAQYYNVAVAADGSVMGAAQNNAMTYIANPSLEQQKSADIVWSIMNPLPESGFMMGYPEAKYAYSEEAQTGVNVVGSAIHRSLPKVNKPFVMSLPYTGLTRTYSDDNDYTEINNTTWQFGTGDNMLMNNQLVSGGGIDAAPFITPLAYWETFNAPEVAQDSVNFTFVVTDANNSMDATRILRGDSVIRLIAGTELFDGDRVLVSSKSLDYPFFYTLTEERFGVAESGCLDFMPEESVTVKIPNPIQTRLFVGAGKGVFVCSEIMNFKKTYLSTGVSALGGLSWVRILNLAANTSVRSIAPSADGNSVLISLDKQNGTCDLVRVSGLNAVDLGNAGLGGFTGNFMDCDHFTSEVLATFNRSISSIVFEQDGDDAYITFDGYIPSESNIKRVKNATSEEVAFEDVALKSEDGSDIKPVYTMLLDAFSEKAYVGTEDGMYEVANRNAETLTWNKVTDVPSVPIYDLYQQTANLPTFMYTSYLSNNATENVFEGTKYSGAIYAASYGRGLFMNRDNLQAAQDTVKVGLQDVVADAQTTVSLYPNPAANSTTLNYTLATSSNVTMVVYDVNGRQISLLNKGSQSAGVHSQKIDLRSMSKGVYVIKIMTDYSVSTAKLIVQ